MLTLAPTYIKTPRGRARAFDSLTNLPAPLKAVLKLVDGKTGTAELLLSVTEGESVEHILLQLEALGLIAERGRTAADAPAAKVPDEACSVAPDAGQPTTVPITEQIRLLQEEFMKSSYASSQAEGWMSTTPADLDDYAAPEFETPLDARVRLVVGSMVTFLLSHSPRSCLAELAVIENFRTPKQLIQGLPRYESLVGQLGPVGTQHIEELSELLMQFFSLKPTAH